MNLPFPMGIKAGSVRVETTNNDGHSPEFFAERLVEKMISISLDAPPEIRMQALAYRESIRSICLGMIERAILSSRTKLIVELRKSGMEDAANLIWKMGT